MDCAIDGSVHGEDADHRSRPSEIPVNRRCRESLAFRPDLTDLVKVPFASRRLIMDEKHLRKLTTDFLVPFLAGSALETHSRPSTKNDTLVALEDPSTIVFKADTDDTYRLALQRTQPFDEVTKGTLKESDVVKAFVEVVRRMQAGLQQWYKADLRAAFPRRVVAKALCSTKSEEEAVLTAIDQLSEWAGREYEGKPIPAALGFVRDVTKGSVPFSEICEEDFSAVLSNGSDTLLTISLNGNVIGHEALSSPDAPQSFAPHQMSAIAKWASKDRIALTLNPAREIMILSNHQLRFTRRSGSWHFLTHTPVLTQMGRPNSREVRKAIYETCLDASFARTGACIGAVTTGNADIWKSIVTSPHDYLEKPLSTKAKTIAAMIGSKKFYELDRRLRQELVAIDGATVLDHEGRLLAVGAILRIDGGSTGGGRLAAAKALSSLGLGIKVSQDGGIRGFHDGKDAPKFQLM